MARPLSSDENFLPVSAHQVPRALFLLINATSAVGPSHCLSGFPSARSGYLLVTPRKIRPDQDFRIMVTIYKMYHASCDVRAVIARDGVEYATQSVSFAGTGTKEMLLKVRGSEGGQGGPTLV